MYLYLDGSVRARGLLTTLSGWVLINTVAHSCGAICKSGSVRTESIDVGVPSQPAIYLRGRFKFS